MYSTVWQWQSETRERFSLYKKTGYLSSTGFNDKTYRQIMSISKGATKSYFTLLKMFLEYSLTL